MDKLEGTFLVILLLAGFNFWFTLLFDLSGLEGQTALWTTSLPFLFFGLYFLKLIIERDKENDEK